MINGHKIKKHQSFSRGAYWSHRFEEDTNSVGSQGKTGWHKARPVPYFSFIIRLKQAIDVLRYRADAIYWSIDFD